MTVLGFTIIFHSPFRVGSAYARDGVDAALDRQEPLPPDHLKGLMRAAAADQLGLPASLIEAVFGSPATPSPWSWSAAVPAGEGWRFSHRHRVQIDPDTHSALKDHLVLGEQAWAERARFEVRRVIATSSNDQLGGKDAVAQETLVLRCAASAVHALGAWRRRGLGWVGIVPDAGPVTVGEVAELMGLAGRHR